MKQPNKTKKFLPKRSGRDVVHRLLFPIVDRLASLLFLYAILALALVILLGVLFPFYPSIIGFIFTGKPSLAFLTPLEASHMADVAALVHKGFLAAAVAVIALLLYHKWRLISQRIIRDALIMSGALLITLIPFSFTFETFHQIFFPQGNWEFPVNSWLISHFSPQFFLGCAIAWFGATAIALWWIMKQTQRV